MFSLLKGLLSRDLNLAIVLALFAVLAQMNGLFSNWDDQFYDLTIRAFYSEPINQNIVIVAIDDKSLSKIGRWPWPRSVHADFLTKLAAIKTKAVGYDVMFAEQALATPINDYKLLSAVEQNSSVVFPVFPESSSYNNQLTVTKPWPELAQIARLGHVDIEIDSDGITRSVFLYAGMNQEIWPAFALSLYNPRQAKAEALSFDENTPEVKNKWVRKSHVYIPFKFLPQTFSFVDVLENKDIRKQLRDKYVIVGMTAAGLHQGFNTPVSKRHFMSGAEIHANILNALIQESTITSLKPLYKGFVSFMLVFLPLFFSRCMIRMQPVLPILAAAVIALAFSVLLLKQLHIRYDPVSVVSLLFLSYLFYNQRSQQFIAQLLFREKAKSQAALSSIGDAVITTDNEGIIDYVNPAAENLTATPLKDSKGLHFDTLLTIQNENGEPTQELSLITEKLQKGLEIKTSNPCLIVNKQGQEYIIRISANPIKDSLKRITGMVFAISDISETFKISRKMAYMATHDPLTGLPNRSLLDDRLNQAIGSANRKKNLFAVLFVDLDGFKKINDGLGHALGDRVLKEISIRLSTEIRENDSVARWGGDEFIVVLTDLISEEVISRITEKIRASLQIPVYLDEHKLFVTPSIGVSIYPKDGLTSELLITRADSAMFKAKERGCNSFCFFSNELNQKAKQRLVLEKEMHHALEEGEFEIYYQPQVDLKTHRIIGTEALLRWNHNSKGFILPDIFIPIAEEIGLINPIGEWVLDSVCKQLIIWQKDGFLHIKTAVNLSPRQFLQPDFSETIHQIIVKHGLNPKLLDLEITESLMIKDVDRICHILEKIKALGVTIAVDDFGTGYSSLSFLKRFPIDQLKIDKSFISQLTSNSHDANIAKALISLAHNMDMHVVAEGIETLEQLNFLNERDCDIGQGFYFSHPLSAKDMTRLLREGKGFLDVSKLKNNVVF